MVDSFKKIDIIIYYFRGEKMLESDLINLNDKELLELLATLEGMNSELIEYEELLKESSDNCENDL